MSCSFCKYLFNVNKVHITIKVLFITGLGNKDQEILSKLLK